MTAKIESTTTVFGKNELRNELDEAFANSTLSRWRLSNFGCRPAMECRTAIGGEQCRGGNLLKVVERG